jgi:type III pantothenate kinase
VTTLLLVDIGNSNTRIAAWQDGALADVHVIPTRDAGEPSRLAARLALGPEDADIALCSVVPAALAVWVEWCTSAGREPFILRGDTPSPLALRYRRPDRLGPDRLAAAVGGFTRAGAPVVVASLGTATFVDAVSPQAEFLGGAIAVGVETGLAALADSTAALPLVPPLHPAEGPIGRNTEECLYSGAAYGTAALLEGLTERLRAEIGAAAPLLLTGGSAEFVSRYLRLNHEVCPDLALQGLAAIYAHNRGEA